MSGRWLLVLYMLLAGGIGWVLFGGPDAVVGLPSTMPAAAEVAAPATAQSLSGDSGAPPRWPQTVERDATSVFDDTEARDLPSVDEDAGLRIEVFRRSGEAQERIPVAGARVLVIDTGRMDPVLLRERMIARNDVTAVMRDIGDPYRTREDGSVVVPYPQQRLVLAASAPGDYAFLFPAEPDADGVVRVDLQVDRPLVVRVRDQDRRTVRDVPIALRKGADAKGNDLLGAVTRRDGTAVLRNLALLQVFAPDGDLYVGLALPLPSAVEQPVDLDDLPREPLELQMPPTGSVRVEVSAPDGSPAVGDLLATLRPRGVGGGGELASQVFARPLESGAVVFPHVGLDMELRIVARDLDMLRAWSEVFSGPTEAGQQVLVELAPLPDEALLVAELVGPGGEPLREARLQVNAESNLPPRTLPPFGIRTDSEGILRAASYRPVKQDEHRVLKLVLPADDDAGRTALHGELVLDAPLKAGENHFGRIQLMEVPLVAAGIVLDTAGEPVAGVDVIPERQREDPRGRVSWDASQQLSARSDGNGHFSIRGSVEDGNWRLRARGAGWAESRTEVPLGTTRAVVRMVRGARLSGRLLLDESIPAGQLRVLLQTQRPDGTSRWNNTTPEPDGSFAWDRLPDGQATLYVRGEQREILASVEGLSLVPGIPTPDARIDPLDLRGQLTRLRLVFVDPDGKRVQQVALTSPDPEGVRWQARDGTLDAVTAKAPLDLTVAAAGYRSRTLYGVAASSQVTLRPGPIIHVEIANPGIVPTGHRIVGWIRDGGRTVGLRFGSAGRATARIDNPGGLRVSLGLRRGDKTQSLRAGGTIQVLDLADPQVFTFRLDGADIESARARLETD